MTDLTEWISERRQFERGATEEPWEADHYTEIDLEGTYPLARVISPDPDDPDTWLGIVPQGILRPDAAWIADARSALPKALAA